MKTTVNINLGGLPFVIDEDAYNRLEQYLKTLNTHFAQTDDQDIVDDIEVRISELLVERMTSGHIVNLLQIEGVISTIGTVEHFGIEQEEKTTSKRKTFARRQSTSILPMKPGKRLFRDPDDSMIGGVCSGLSTYFGIQDPIFLRISVIVVAFWLGFSYAVIPYIVFWILLPAAETDEDYESLQGEFTTAKDYSSTISQKLKARRLLKDPLYKKPEQSK